MNKELSANTNLSHYRIVSKLGAGGMGEVYLAEDTKLRRRVALKVLPEGIATDKEGLRRFEQEAFAASALNHPNILTIFEFGASGGKHFLAAEYVTGVTLRERIKQSDLALPETLDIAVQIASALCAAHEAGIIHRDIKPENVMLRKDGYVKILDFGLAKLIENAPLDAESETRTQLQTQAGMIMGTAAYMSPEQARGKQVDARTDVFSFGCVLYEILARRQPFTGETINHTIVNILEKEPPAVSQFAENTPAEIERIVRKCLAKAADERYKSAKDLLADLKELKEELSFRAKLERSATPNKNAESSTQIIRAAATAETGTRETNSIAVLPFVNMSADEENEYFCDGLAEELLNALSKIEDLRVAARTSAFSFKGKNANASEIGEKLNVKTILDGSVRRSGNHLRISVQIVNAANGFQLWSERYDREMRDIFDVQDEIALAVVDALKVKLFGDEKATILKRYTDNTEAYQLYLKGQFHYGKYSEAGWRKAIEYFNQALALEPDYAPAYAGIASAGSHLWYYGCDAGTQAIAKIRKAIAGALSIDADLAEAYRSQAVLQFFADWDFPAAEQSFARALSLNPNDALAHSFYGFWLVATGRREQAVTAARRALELDPLSLVSGVIAGWTLWFAESYKESLEMAQTLLEINSHFGEGFRLLGLSYWGLENYAAAEDALQNAVAEGAGLIALANLCGVYAHDGRQAEARKTLQQIRAMSEQSYVPAAVTAYCYTFLDEVEEALVWLEQAFAERNGELVFLSVLPNRMISFRRHPRFTDLLRRIGLPTNEADEAQTIILKPTTAGDKQIETASETAEKSIAVLPFTDMSADGDNEYFCDGLAEELLNALAKIDELKVAARTSAFAFKGKNANASEIGKVLKVKAILEGSVRKAGNRLRISVQLINAANGFHLWSERFDRELKDIFDIQDEITLAVVDRLKLKLFGDEKAELLKRGTENAEAYQLYLQGRFFSNKFTVEGIEKAIELYERAIAVDSEYAMAYVGISDAYFFLGIPDATTGILSPQESLPKALAAAEKALEIDSSLGDAWAALAHVKEKSFDVQGAKEAYRKSFESRVNDPNWHFYYGIFLSTLGEHEKAIAEIRRGQELDPLSAPCAACVGYVLHNARRYDDAIRELKKALELAVAFPLTHQLLGMSYVQKGDYGQAIKAFQTACDYSHRSIVSLASLAHAYAVSGNRSEAEKLLGELLDLSERRYVSPYSIARIYVGLNEKEKAFEFLERAWAEKNVEMVFINVAPVFDSLRGDSRFQNLIRRIGLPTNQTNQTDESLEAQTVMLSAGELKADLPADLQTRNANLKQESQPTTNPKSAHPNPKSKWRLFGLLILILTVSGIFAYRYFAPNTKQIESIAVMPFVNESGNPELEYLSDGMTETLISSLSQLPNLNIKPRSLVFRYKGREADPQTIGKELNVQAVFNGRVASRGADLSLFVELIDVASTKVIWSQQYNRKQNEIVSLQSEIARDISSRLKTGITNEEETKVTKNYTDNPEAYRLYLRGNSLSNRRKGKDVRMAIEAYEQAIALDPKYALAYTGLSNAHLFMVIYGGAPPMEEFSKARAAAMKALELDPTLPGAHAALGAVTFFQDRDFNALEQGTRRDLELSPNNANAYRQNGLRLAWLGRFDEAIASHRRSLEIEPLSLVTVVNYAWCLFYAGRLDESDAQLKVAQEIDPSFWYTEYQLFVNSRAKGDYASAAEHLARAHELRDEPETAKFIRDAFQKGGWRGLIESALASPEGSKMLAYERATFAAELGKKDKAFALLGEAYDKYDQFIFFMKIDPFMDSLRDDPRFSELLKKLGFPE